MNSVFLAPHNDDETLFGSYLIQRHRPDVVIVLWSDVQENRGTGITGGMREHETRLAAATLNPDIRVTQQPWSDASPPWPEIEVWIRDYALRYDHCFAPAVEEDGHAHHNAVGRMALREFGSDRVTRYLTYTTNGPSVWGVEVEPTPDEIVRKLRALACYESQIREPTTRPHFLGSLREYVVA